MGKNKKIKFDEDESTAATSEVDANNEKEHATEEPVVGQDGDKEELSKRKRVRKHSKKEKKEKEAREKRSHIAPSVLSGKCSSNKRSAGDDDEEEEEDIANIPGSELYANESTIYLEGFPFDSTEADLRRFFQKIGGEIISMRLPTWHDSGRLKGNGHIQFDCKETADKAIELNGNYMGKRYLKIEKPKIPTLLKQAAQDNKDIKKIAGCKTVFVKNIPYDTTEEDMKRCFMVCGTISGIRLAVWGHTNTLKGFGYVEFDKEDSALIAVKKSGKLQINDRPLMVDYETGAPKTGFKKIKV